MVQETVGPGKWIAYTKGMSLFKEGNATYMIEMEGIGLLGIPSRDADNSNKYFL